MPQQGVVHPDIIYPAPPGNAGYAAKNQNGGTLPTRRRRIIKRRRNPFSHRCCCVTWWSSVLTLIVLLGFVVLVFWLVVRPHSPHYSVAAVRVLGLDSRSMQSLSVNDTLSTAASFVIVARNPNPKLHIIYDPVSVDVELLGVIIGKTVFPSFSQGTKNSTFLTANLTSGNIRVNVVSQQEILTASKTGKVPVDFNLNLKARMKVGILKSPKFKVSVHCRNVTVPTIPGKANAAPIDGTCSYKLNKA